MAKQTNYSDRIRDILDETLTSMQPELAEALGKKLSHIDQHRLKLWLDEERREAARQEWERQKDRIKE